jgi:hypothetical protein
MKIQKDSRCGKALKGRVRKSRISGPLRVRRQVSAGQSRCIFADADQVVSLYACSLWGVADLWQWDGNDLKMAAFHLRESRHFRCVMISMLISSEPCRALRGHD